MLVYTPNTLVIIPVSHVRPMKYGRHLHEKDFSWFLHSALFLHGDESQGSGSKIMEICSEKNRNQNIIYFPRITEIIGSLV